MRNILSTKTELAVRRWSLRIIGWGLGLPAGWWIVSTSYRMQQSWEESRFVTVYLLLYVFVALLAFLARTRDSHLPGVTLWGLCVFAGVGLGRLLWAMVQYEYGTEVNVPIATSLWTLLLGSASLGSFLAWEWHRDQQMNRERFGRSAANRVTVVNRPAVPVAQFDDVAWW